MRSFGNHPRLKYAWNGMLSYPHDGFSASDMCKHIKETTCMNHKPRALALVLRKLCQLGYLDRDRDETSNGAYYYSFTHKFLTFKHQQQPQQTPVDLARNP